MSDNQAILLHGFALQWVGYFRLGSWNTQKDYILAVALRSVSAPSFIYIQKKPFL